jgi:hypothetical protein
MSAWGGEGQRREEEALTVLFVWLAIVMFFPWQMSLCLISCNAIFTPFSNACWISSIVYKASSFESS